MARRGAASSKRRWPPAAPGGAGWLAGRLAGCWLAAACRQQKSAPSQRLTVVKSQARTQTDQAEIYSFFTNWARSSRVSRRITMIGVNATFTTIVCLYLCICTSRDITPQCLKCSALPNIIYYDTRGVPRAYMIPKSHTWNSFTSKCE